MTRYEFCIKGRPRLAEPFHLKAVGLPNVYLWNGVTIQDDPDYGQLVTIEYLADLHRAIGLRIVIKDNQLTGGELRYLRKQMVLTQAGLAKQLRISNQTVANYEKGKTEAGAADTAVRLLYLAHTAPNGTLAELCKHVADAIVSPAKKLPARTQRKIASRWHEADRQACM